MRAQAMMAMMIGVSLCTLAGAAGAQTASASAPAATKAPSQCFYSHDWDGWKASPDSKSIYIRVGVSHYYKIDFSDSCPTLNAPNAHLITKTVNDLICSAIDLDLKVSDSPGFAVPCIVSAISPMSPADVAALPKKLKP